MNHAREKRKRKEALNHRYWQLDKAFDGLLAGTHTPEYVKARADKFKMLKGK